MFHHVHTDSYDMSVENNLETFLSDYDDWLVLDEDGNDVTAEGDTSFEEMIKGFDFAVSLIQFNMITFYHKYFAIYVHYMWYQTPELNIY